MFDRRMFAHVFFMITGCLYSGIVWATMAPPPLLSGLPWPQIGVGALLSIWGGLTRTAERALDASKVARDKGAESDFQLWHEIGRDVAVSAGLGFFIYGVSATMQWDVWILGSALWLGGYSGTQLLDALRKALVSYVGRKGDTV